MAWRQVFVALLMISQLLALTNIWPSTLQPHQTVPIQNETVQTSITTQANSNCLPPSRTDQSQVTVQPSNTYVTIPESVLPNVRNGMANVLPQPVPQSLLLHMKFVFKIRNQIQFAKCLASVSDPSSPDYGHFLNATTLQPYIPTPGEKASVLSFFTSKGFTVNEDASPIVIDLSAPVGTVQQVLGVSFAIYRSGNLTFYASNSDPKLPQNFASLAIGIVGLDNSTRNTTCFNQPSMHRSILSPGTPGRIWLVHTPFARVYRNGCKSRSCDRKR